MSRQRFHYDLLLEGRRYSPQELLKEAALVEEGDSSFRALLLSFLQEWYNDSSSMQIRTSGSTGVPKVISIRKEQMVNSARMTCSFLGLYPGECALLCMPLQYIGARMMVVRAMVWELDLWLAEPSGNPLSGKLTPDFVAMTPMQVYNTLKNPGERARLEQVRNLLIGGSAVDPLLEKELSLFPGKIWSTYGMTETVSHIALRRVNGQKASPFYSPLSQVTLTLSSENTLVIHAPLVCDKVVVTNDIAEINSDGTFRILGRSDNVINSGGIKIRIEEVEERLKTLLDVPFLVTSAQDSRYGERLVLLVEQEITAKQLEQFRERLPRYWIPGKIIVVEKLPLTENQKPDRTRARKMVE